MEIKKALLSGIAIAAFLCAGAWVSGGFGNLSAALFSARQTSVEEIDLARMPEAAPLPEPAAKKKPAKKPAAPKAPSIGAYVPAMSSAPRATTSSGPVAATSAVATATPPVPQSAPAAATAGRGNVKIAEVMMGSTVNSAHDFVELHNDADAPASLSGCMLKKTSSTGSESTLVSASRLEGKTIPARGDFLLANEDGYSGLPRPDVAWPGSYSLSGTKNGVSLHCGGTPVDGVSWNNIPAGSSIVRDVWAAPSFHVSASPSPEGNGR